MMHSMCKALVSACNPHFISNFHEGDSDPAVLCLKQLLNTKDAHLAPDTYFHPATTISVLKFQRHQGLMTMGVVDKLTWAYLQQTCLDLYRHPRVQFCSSSSRR